MKYDKIEKIWNKHNVYDLLYKKYKKQINENDFEAIKQEIIESDYIVNEYELKEGYDDFPIKANYIGSVLSIAPSGKYYMPWCTNQTQKDCIKDEAYFEALNEVLSDHNIWYMNGEGDALDIFFCMSMETV